MNQELNCNKIRIAWHLARDLRKNFSREFDLAKQSRDFKMAKFWRTGLERKIKDIYELLGWLPITVDYSKRIEDIIRENDFSCRTVDITSVNFPSQKQGKETIYVKDLHFGKSMMARQILEEMAKENVRPASLRELLVYRMQPESLRVHLAALSEEISRDGKNFYFVSDALSEGRFSIERYPKSHLSGFSEITHFLMVRQSKD